MVTLARLLPRRLRDGEVRWMRSKGDLLGPELNPVRSERSSLCDSPLFRTYFEGLSRQVAGVLIAELERTRINHGDGTLFWVLAWARSRRFS
jgi:hypothetical protein